MKSVIDRFLTYVTYDTKSNTDSLTTPSTESQLVFGDIPWLRLFRYTFDVIGTENLHMGGSL